MFLIETLRLMRVGTHYKRNKQCYRFLGDKAGKPDPDAPGRS